LLSFANLRTLKVYGDVNWFQFRKLPKFRCLDYLTLDKLYIKEFDYIYPYCKSLRKLEFAEIYERDFNFYNFVNIIESVQKKILKDHALSHL
jgi:hypothetical protein